MDAQVHAPQRGYGIVIEPLQGLVTARRNGILLAQSSRAKVMYETRLPPAIYFPLEDVATPLSPNTPLQTFCPFKGTASYRDLLLTGGGVENGVWSYEEAMPEAAAISDYIGFMPGAKAEFDLGSNSIEMPDYGNISGPVIDWLLRDAALIPTPDDLTAALAEKFVEQGICLPRLSVMDDAGISGPDVACRHFRCCSRLAADGDPPLKRIAPGNATVCAGRAG